MTLNNSTPLLLSDEHSQLVTICKRIKFIFFDFDGVFTDNSVYISEKGTEYVRCTREDGFGLQKLRALNIGMMVLSTEINPVVTKRCKKLHLDCINGVIDKKSILLEIIRKKNLKLSELGYVGNDVNDNDCLGIVGLPIIVADAHPDTYNCAHYITKKNGGHGAVREICDLVHKIVTDG